MSAAELADQFPHPPAASDAKSLPAAATGTCRICGCTSDHACVSPAFGPCWWVEPNLCSHCAEPAIVADLFADMQRRLEAGEPFAALRIDQWSKRAYSALLRVSASPMALFEP